MSKQSEEAAFKEYLESLKADVPAEQHALFDALATNEKFRERSFKGTLRQDEFHRRLNELEAEKKKWQEWHAAELPKNEMLMAAKADLERKLQATLAAAGITDPDPGEPPTKGDVTKQEIEELRQKLGKAENALVGMNQALPHFLKDSLKISHLIVKNGYDLDPGQVLDYSMQHGVTPDQAFEALRKDEDEKRREAAILKREADAREAGRLEALSSRHTPDFAGRASASPIVDHLRGKEDLSDQRTRQRAAAASLKQLLAGGGTA